MQQDQQSVSDEPPIKAYAANGSNGGQAANAANA